MTFVVGRGISARDTLFPSILHPVYDFVPFRGFAFEHRGKVLVPSQEILSRSTKCCGGLEVFGM